MVASSRDRISVDLGGLRAALFAKARAEGVSPSTFVRGVLADALGGDASKVAVPSVQLDTPSQRTRLSLRLTPKQVEELSAAAQAAGLPIGTFVAELVAGVPAVVSGAKRTDHLAALTQSSAELSTLSRDLHQLTSLLRQSNLPAAQQYRALLDTVADDVRRHLQLASAALADLRPSKRPTATAPRPTN